MTWEDVYNKWYTVENIRELPREQRNTILKNIRCEPYIKINPERIIIKPPEANQKGNRKYYEGEL